MDRLFWWDGAQWQAHDAHHVSGLAPGLVAPPAEPMVRPPGYWRDFWLGFAGVVAGNIVLFIVITATTPPLGSPGPVASLSPWILNLGALILFAIIRPRVAIGMLAAYGAAFGLVLLAGCLLAVLCFGGAVRVP